MEQQYDNATLNRLLKDQAILHHSRIHTLPLLGCRQPVRFLLLRPDEATVCPITHEPIATSTLANYESTRFDPEHPDRTAIRLPCQHEFTATCLLYYWMRNETVRCPMCRATPPAARLNISGLPAHLRLHIPDDNDNDYEEEYLSDTDEEEFNESEPEEQEPITTQRVWTTQSKSFEEIFKGLYIGNPPHAILSSPKPQLTLGELLRRPANPQVFQFSA